MIQLIELLKPLQNKKAGDRVRAEHTTLAQLKLKPGVDYRPLGTDTNPQAKIDITPGTKTAGTKATGKPATPKK